MRQKKRAKDSRATPEGVVALDDAQHIIHMPNGRSTLVSALERLFGPSSEAVVARDSDERLLYTNPAFSELVGLDAEASLGQLDPFPWSIEGGSAACEERSQFLESEQARKLGIGLFAWSVRHASGEYRPVWLSRRKLVSKGGATLGDVFIHIDRAPTWSGRENGVAGRIEELEASIQRIALAIEQLGVPVGMRPAVRPLGPRAEFSTLSPREGEVLQPLLEGHRVPYIARMLYISPHTVRNHLQSVFRKLGVASQAELIEKLLAGETEVPEPSADAPREH
ncbi:MAG: PAS and helix-turn-helix domain-containing protein [Deltaproteobacteria bacterium]|nr:MAG: PAS and helix-turn-helix domain-containing protein [Deltaproteobacteria bacterium]